MPSSELSDYICRGFIRTVLMSAPPASLDDLRREIDAIDDALHAGLLRRAALMERVAAAKPGHGLSSPMRPGREASVLRRLLERSAAPLAPAVVARIWRELTAAALSLQGPLSVAVCGQSRSVGYWDLARNHFGSSTPMTLHVSPMVALRHVVDQAGGLAVVPLPQEGERDPWWRAMLSDDAAAPRILWRLPFFASLTGRFEDLGAFVVGRAAPEPTGLDVSVVAFETSPAMSRARLLDELKKQGLVARILAAHEDGSSRLNLLEIDDFVARTDPRLVGVAAACEHDLLRIVVLGAYPTPMDSPRR